MPGLSCASSLLGQGEFIKRSPRAAQSTYIAQRGQLGNSTDLHAAMLILEAHRSQIDRPWIRSSDKLCQSTYIAQRRQLGHSASLQATLDVLEAQRSQGREAGHQLQGLRREEVVAVVHLQVLQPSAQRPQGQAKVAQGEVVLGQHADQLAILCTPVA